MSWINDLDSLASSGVIAFDAPAYILGKQPRYYGNPAFYNIPDEFPKMQPQPQKDEFDSGVNPKWKKTLFSIKVIDFKFLCHFGCGRIV